MSLDGKQYYSVIFDEVGISDADRQGCARAPSPLILLTRLNELRTVRAKEWNSCHVASPAKWGALARIVLASACLPGSRRVMLAPLCLPPPIHSTCTFRDNSRHNWTSQEQPERSARGKCNHGQTSWWPLGNTQKQLVHKPGLAAADTKSLRLASRRFPRRA